MKKRIAIVSVRFGQGIVGGGEVHVNQYAQLLKEKYEVDVITTSTTDSVTWKNDIKITDNEQVNGVNILRFKIDKLRDISENSEFHRTFLYLSNYPFDSQMAEKFIQLDGPISTGLIEYLRNNHHKYFKIIYWPYLYATTTLGVRVTPKEKNILLPTAHNEPNLFFPYVAETFSKSSYILYNTDEEKSLIEKIHKPKSKGKIVSMYIENKDPSKDFLKRFKINYKYVIYVGRIEGGKGVDKLLDYFLSYKDKNPSDLKLILVGKAIMEIPRNKDIVFLGYLSEEDKIAAIRHAEFLIQPSLYESLSIVLIESLLEERPVLVNGNNPVLVGHCRRGNCGLWYTTRTEFYLSVKYLLSKKNKKTVIQLGKNGKDYAEKNYNKELISKRLYKAIEESEH